MAGGVGPGVDAVLEVVGSPQALALGYELLRPFGVLSSVGVHTAPTFPLNGGNLYDKNVAMSFGRCPVRSILPMAFGVLERHGSVLVGVDQMNKDGLVERIVHVDEAPAMYKLFEERGCGKVLFRFD
ncbi:hypothetical protein HDU67_003925 [Dinochytrium kinnereticum]|nr:hypothetical protein HDU67_003925 [Dinochytrium kinnereticum]